MFTAKVSHKRVHMHVHVQAGRHTRTHSLVEGGATGGRGHWTQLVTNLNELWQEAELHAEGEGHHDCSTSFGHRFTDCSFRTG